MTKIIKIAIIWITDEEGIDMLITRETDYALRILRALSSGECLTVGELSKQEFLPQHFAYKIVKKLEKAGFLRIIRGANGGCHLEADLKRVSLYDLSGAVEDHPRLTSCMNPSHQCEWRQAHGGICTAHIQLAKVQKAVDDEFRSRSLSWILFGENHMKDS